MAQRGAKHIVTMSRTGLQSRTAQSMVKEMSSQHVTLTVLQCDVSDASSVAASLDSMINKIPAIRGIIQAAMILQVCNLHKR